jgi:regulator of cell morphogenesis and NO signaling
MYLKSYFTVLLCGIAMFTLESCSSEHQAQLAELEQLSLIELVNHIEATHHKYVRNTAPLLQEYTEIMVNAHGDDHDEILPLAQWVNSLMAELMPHLMKEERILFPAIRSLSVGEEINGCFGHISNPINVMEHEHGSTADILIKLRQITSNYQVPEGACNTWRTCYKTLAEFDIDLQMHIHLENNLLFPKALGL